jgi:hypothetical protein
MASSFYPTLPTIIKIIVRHLKMNLFLHPHFMLSLHLFVRFNQVL